MVNSCHEVFSESKSYVTIMDILKKRAITNPEDIAYTFLSFSGNERSENSITYKELDIQARKIGAYLQKLNMSGECAILLYPDGLEFISAFFGCLYAKVIAVPLYHFITKRKAGRVLTVIEDSEAKIFLSDNDHISNVKSFTSKNLPDKNYHWFTMDKINEVNSEDYREMDNNSDDLAYLQYTSGSTSAPKGVMITQKNIMHNMSIIKWHYEHSENSVGVSWIPHYHDMGLIYAILQPVYVGYRQVLMQPTDFITKPYRFLKAVSDFKGTTFTMPNFAYEHCINHISEEERKSLDLSSITNANDGAEPCYWSTIQSFYNSFKECGFRENILVPGYGLAEATLVVTGRNPDIEDRSVPVVDIDKKMLEKNVVKISDSPDSFRCCSVGSPRKDMNVVIADPATMKKCAEGIVGEVWIASDSNSPGYWKKDQANEETFNAKLADTYEGPFLRTGDLGFMYKGNLYISGRLKDVIIIRGANYYPNDIEYTVAHCHPDLVPNSCAAFSVTIDNQERLFIAQEIKRTASNSIDAEEVFGEIRKVVTEVHGLQVYGILLLRYGLVYKTSSGKVQRKLCKESYLKGELQALYKSIVDIDDNGLENKELTNEEILKNGVEPARLIIEKDLINRVVSLLKIDEGRVRKDRSLVSLGLDSISLTVLKQGIEDRYMCQIDITTIFDSSLTKLAGIIADSIKEGNIKADRENITLPVVIPNMDKIIEEFPLTELQAAYWMGRNDGFELGGVSAHAYMEVTVKDMDVDNVRLSQAWNMLIERHHMLRGVITKDGRQKILQDTPLYDICYHNLQDCSPEVQKEQYNNVRQKLINQVIPLDSWPWVEIHHTKYSPEKSILHISIDLLIADIWSINILYREWFRLYKNPQEILPQLEMTFRDYCLAMEELKEKEYYKKSESYWRKRIDSIPAAPSLPLAKALKDVNKVEFKHRAYEMPMNLWVPLKERALQYGVTPSVLLMAAFSKILGIWSKASRFSLNLTLFNRLPFHQDINNIVGDFTSVMILEVDNEKSLKFAEFAKSIQCQLAKDMEHRYYSGVNVIRELAKEWGKSPQEAVLPIVFTSALSAEGPMVFQSQKEFFGHIDNVSQTPQVYMDHQVYEEENNLVLSWDTVDELFPKNMLNDMFEAYTTLLNELATCSETWEKEISSLLPKHQLNKRIQYNKTETPMSKELLFSNFIKNASSNPDGIAVITSSRSLTYKETLNGAANLAGDLQQKGVKPNQLVAVSMHKGWEQVIAVMGILMAGGAYVCIDPGLPQERREYLMKHSELNLVVSRTEQQLPSGISCIVIDEDILKEGVKYVDTKVKPDDLAYVLYTSGSTGLPKGVSISHRGALNTIIDINKRFEVNSKDKALALSSLSFDLSVYDIFGMLHAGGAIVMPDPSTERDPEHWMNMIERYKVTLWNSVPSLMEMLVESLEALNKKVQLRLVMMSGDWIPVNLPERIWQINQTTKVVSLGGATEASIWSIYYPVNYVDSKWTSIPYGIPLDNQTFYVLNKDMGDCPDWVPGELYIGGIGVALDYYHDTEKTKKSFLIHPQTGERIYKTGDLGRFNPEGYIEFLGREDSQVKIGGHRIELGEIESVLGNHPKVRRAVAKKVVNKDGNITLAAYVVLNTLGKLDKVKSTQKDKYDLASEIINDGDSIITDPHQRLLFKLGNHGLRFNTKGCSLDSSNLDVVSLDHCEEKAELYINRISSRRFLDKNLTLQNISNLLGCLKKIDIDGMKRFRYGSAGGLYPVQVYIYIKPHKVEGLRGGIYYYHPYDNAIIFISGPEGMDEKIHVDANKAIFNSSSFSIFLVGKLSAIRPLYGNKAKDFCLIEAGLITQLLENSAAENELGLCQVGAMADEKCIHELLKLDEEHVLLHVLLGGNVDCSDVCRGMLEYDKPVVNGDCNEITEQLKEYCSTKLPHYMVPACLIYIDDIPLTSVGKVNYKALPEPVSEVTVNNSLTFSPSNEMEELIHNIFKEKSGITCGLDVNRSLFELGINSLTITRAWRDIITQTGIDFPVTRIFEKPTISALAIYLNQIKKQDDRKEINEEVNNDKAIRQREAISRRRVLRK